MRKQFWVWGVVGFLLAAQGCKVEVAEDDSDGKDSKSEAKTDERVREPSAVKLTSDEKSENKGFSTPEYRSGPDLDQSKNALRALQEADVVQVAGNKLYTFSGAAGLSVIDLSQPNELRMLGQYRVSGTPFEMFVRGDTVVALLREVEDSAGEASSSESRRTSRIVALDATDPTQIRETSHLNVPGSISEGRILDNILYAASYENGDCYNCGDNPNTTVVSVDVSTPSNLRQVDREVFSEVAVGDGWSKRSVEINDNRLYISGLADGTNGSTIQVVDISDTTGNMQLGARVPVTGSIYSRWQMDEYLGVLRVISQPSDFRSEMPVIQTFTITDSSHIEPLGSTTMNVPSAEKLRGIRFDGTRAFAITYEKTDPLFTIDLSDPARPAQVGELEMPGFVYHLEVRDNRLYGMGFEVNNDAGGLHVSLFDVSDLRNPTMLDRVNFGPTWPSNWSLTEGEYLVENENRVHQVFKVLDDLGTILVPFQGWSNQTAGCGNYSSAVQIVDFTPDDLTLRGSVSTTGAIRRALIHGERLIGVSEQHVESFNITNRATPTRQTGLELAFRAHRTVPVGNRVLRLRSNWWTHVAEADVVDVGRVANPASAGAVNLSSAINEDVQSCQYHDDSSFQNAPVFALGENHAVVVVVRPDPHDAAVNITNVLVLDVHGDVPTVAGRLELDYEPINTGLGAGVAMVGNALVIQRPGDTTQGDTQNIVLEVIDLSDPAHPRAQPGLSRPLAAGTTGLFANGNNTASGYYTVNNDRAEYRLDRVSFEDPAHPVASDAVTVPGLLLGRVGSNFATVNFVWTPNTRLNESACESASGDYESATRTCWVPSRPLSLVSVDGSTAQTLATGTLNMNLDVNAVLVGQDRTFLLGTTDGRFDAFVLGGTDRQLQTSTVATGYISANPVVRGTDLFYLSYGDLKRVDASAADRASVRVVAPSVAENVNHLSVSGNTAILSSLDTGIRTVALQ